MNSKLLSIIVPVYNGECYIEDTVKSILSSTHKNIQVLLINDGSLDESGDICNTMSLVDERVEVFHKTNGGIADARNYGLSLAKGDYIAFADQDDFVPPEMYAELIEKIEASGCDVVVSNFATFKDNPNSFEACDCIKTDINILGDELEGLRKWLLIGEVMDLPEITVSATVWNCIFSAEIIKKCDLKFKSYIRFDDDYIFLIEFLRNATSCALTKKSYYRWRVHNKSESHTKKYIENLYNKYYDMYQFKKAYMNSLTISSEEKKKIANYFADRVNSSCIMNESIKVTDFYTFKQKRREICGIIKNSKQLYGVGNISSIKYLFKKHGKKAGLIALLARFHCVSLAIVVSLYC